MGTSVINSLMSTSSLSIDSVIYGETMDHRMSMNPAKLHNHINMAKTRDNAEQKNVLRQYRFKTDQFTVD